MVGSFMHRFSSNAKQVFLGVWLLLAGNAFCQSPADTIEIRKNRFYYNNRNLSTGELREKLRVNPELIPYLGRARNNQVFNTLFGIPGGVLLGYQIGTAVGGAKINWTIFSVGAGMVLLSIPFHHAVSKNMKSAVLLYNGKRKELSARPPSFHFQLGMNGFGLGLRF